MIKKYYGKKYNIYSSQNWFDRLPNKNIQKIGNETLLSRKIKICLKANIGDVIIIQIA